MLIACHAPAQTNWFKDYGNHSYNLLFDLRRDLLKSFFTPPHSFLLLHIFHHIAGYMDFSHYFLASPPLNSNTHKKAEHMQVMASQSRL